MSSLPALSIYCSLALVDAALVIDDTPPPADRPWPMYATPPIEGFNYKDYISGDNEDVEEGIASAVEKNDITKN